MREDPDASSPRRQDPSNGEPCRVALRERPRWRWSPRRALPATSSCASGPRSGGGGGDLGHAARGCARKARLLPLAVGGDLQMESTFALEETLAAVFAQICNRSSRRCLCRLGRCGIRPALGARYPCALHIPTVHPYFQMIWQVPLSTKDCTSQIEGTQIETDCYWGYMFAADPSTFSETNKLRIDLTAGRYTFCVLIKTAVHSFFHKKLKMILIKLDE